MNKLTKHQAIVMTGFTGCTCIKFEHFHEDVEKRLGHPVFTHMFADKEFMEKVADLYRADFLAMLPEEE